VGALRRDGKTLVVALLACGWPNNKTYKWTDTRKLMEYGLNEFEFTDFESIELPDEAFGEIYVDNAKGDSIGANVYVGVECGASEGVEGILVNKNENITVVIKKAKMLTAPVAKGEQIGYISYMADGVEWMRKNLVTAENIGVIDLKWCVEMVLDKWYIKNSLNLQKITSRIE
jgi:D-alanyl-D-alanine carboxypeptidase (penicillin-binding protein 5/6)